MSILSKDLHFQASEDIMTKFKSQGLRSYHENQMLKLKREWLSSLSHFHPLQHRHFT